MKNGEIAKVAPLEIEINRHKEKLKVAVMDLDGTNIFLEHDWLVKIIWKSIERMAPSSLQDVQEIVQWNTKTYNSNLGEPRQQKQWITRNRTMGKSERNRTRQNQKIYKSTFGPSHIYSTKRNLKSYWKNVNGTTR